MKKYLLTCLLIAVVIVVGILLWFALTPHETRTFLGCEPKTGDTTGTCARLIHTVNMLGLDRYQVEFTPTTDGKYAGNSRQVVIDIDATCGKEYATNSWSQFAFTIAKKNGSGCSVERKDIGAW